MAKKARGITSRTKRKPKKKEKSPVMDMGNTYRKQSSGAYKFKNKSYTDKRTGETVQKGGAVRRKAGLKATVVGAKKSVPPRPKPKKK